MNKAGSSSKPSAPTPETFSTLHTELQSAALKATRASAGLPLDLAFYKSVDEDLKTSVDDLEARVLALIGRCIGLANGKGKGKEVRVEGEDVIDDFHGTIVDSVDVLLERTDICLDEYSGKLKRPAAPAKPAAASSSTQKPTDAKPYLPASLQHASNIPKPQELFPTQVDNSDDVQPPHIRFLKHKYNARVPLGYVLQKEDIEDSFTDEPLLLSSHPYYYEITHLQFPAHVHAVPSSPSSPPSLPSPVTYVSTPAQFDALLEHLTSPSVLEIAIDLEHHSYRTYRGFLCLMQLTTRTGGDFIVDLLVPSLRARIHELNAPFTDPSKIKVLHGADSDIVWLQQDFGVYIVGMFDTFHASKMLDLPRHSLATLLELYADYTPDKRFQLADWRIRPLPEEMLSYAQSDTHWLLYLYDRLRAALVDKESSRPGSPDALLPSTTTSRTLLDETLFRSSQTSLRQYVIEEYDALRGSGPGGWDTLAKKWNKVGLTYLPSSPPPTSTSGSISQPAFENVFRSQRLIYTALHGWRDRTSRAEDESTRYVLPNHFLFTLAENPPADMSALLGRFKGGGVPAVVKRRAKELLEVIRGAVREGMVVRQQEVKEVEGKEDGLGEKMVVDEDGDGKKDVDEGKVVGEVSRSSLWGTGSRHLVATSSTLLGAPSSSSALTTSTSTLFGSVLPSSNTANSSIFSSTRKSDNPTFKALVSKINRTLVIVPSIPKTLFTTHPPSTPSSSSASPAKPELETEGKGDAAIDVDETLGMQIDSKPMAFIPASQRTRAGGMEDMGPIVQVGRKSGGGRNAKKRKRQGEVGAAKGGEEDGVEVDDDAEVEGGGGEGSSTIPPEGHQNDEEEEPYDFDATPNVLDGPSSKKRAKKSDPNNAAQKSKKAKKGKVEKKGAAGYFYNPEFGAPPKQRSDFKGGNKSSTFK